MRPSLFERACPLPAPTSPPGRGDTAASASSHGTPPRLALLEMSVNGGQLQDQLDPNPVSVSLKVDWPRPSAAIVCRP